MMKSCISLLVITSQYQDSPSFLLLGGIPPFEHYPYVQCEKVHLGPSDLVKSLQTCTGRGAGGNPGG